MSCKTIERRYTRYELKYMIICITEIIENVEKTKGIASSLMLDNLPIIEPILQKLLSYKQKLDVFSEEYKNKECKITNYDTYVLDNETYLNPTIGIILSLEEYYILYFYFNSASLNFNDYVNNLIIQLKIEIANCIAKTSSWNYLCYHGIKK